MLRRIGLLWVMLCSLASWTAEASAQRRLLGVARVVAGSADEREGLMEAGAGGATLELSYGSRVVVEAGSRFRFARSVKLPIGPPSQPLIPTTVLRFERGRLEARVRAPKHYALQVLGPRELRVIVKGGAASVLAQPDGAAVVSREGVGLVSLGRGWRRLSAGESFAVNALHPRGSKRPVLPAPAAPQLERHLWLAVAPSSDAARVSWSPVDRASGYELRVDGLAGGEPASTRRVAAPPFALAAPAPGRYQLRVRAIDDAGLEGTWSEPTELQVVGLRVPASAGRGRRGQIRLQPGQRVALLGAEGLEIGYPGFAGFLPAPPDVGLVARRPVSLLLRHPGTRQSVPLRLEPMSVRADISLPRSPGGWPADGLALAVNLVDSEGYEVPESFVAECRVSVNLVPVSPRWSRQGSRLQARIEAPEGTERPWIVRVDVRDARGFSLGMDFVDLGYASPSADRSR